MALLARNIVLIAIDRFADAAGGRVRGKTLLQKQLYFVSVLASVELGYRAHYCGPYSDAVADAIVELKNLGFVQEYGPGVVSDGDTRIYETRRYDYELTDNGRTALGWLRSRYPRESQRIVDAAQKILERRAPEPTCLITVAKVHWILRYDGGLLSDSEIVRHAVKLSWAIDEGAVCQAKVFLEDLGLLDQLRTARAV